MGLAERVVEIAPFYFIFTVRCKKLTVNMNKNK